MAIDAILEENLHPRTSAPVADLDDIFQWIFYGEKDEKRDFKDYFHSIPQNKIHREQIRHLRIVGDADDAAIRHFLDAGLSRGFYLNADGTWLLVILPDTPHLGDYFTRYGAMAESLWIFSSQMYGRDFRKMPNLTELVLNSNPLLDTLDHLDKLTKLTGLYIYECPRLTMLPGLESLTQLTKLTLSGCNNLTDFSALQNLTQLTKLNLSKSESLTALPGLEKLTQLTKLNLSGCIGLTELLGLEKLTQLTYLNLTGCQNIAVLPELNNLIHLSELDLMGCSKLTSLPSLKNLTLLTKLNLMLCRGITTLPEDLRYCKDLRKLTLSFMHLQDLPDWLRITQL